MEKKYNMRQVSGKSLHLVNNPGQSTTTGKLLYIPVQQAIILTSCCIIIMSLTVEAAPRSGVGHFLLSCDQLISLDPCMVSAVSIGSCMYPTPYNLTLP